MNIPEWHDAAICRTVDPELWWPPKGGDNNPAKAICRTCPVVEPCLQHALDHDEAGGIWGATSPIERKRLRREKRQRDGGVRCVICDRIFPGSAQHMYCSKVCQQEGRRRLARKRYAS